MRDRPGADGRGGDAATPTIDGEVVNLVVNGVEVRAYVEAELDRRHPDAGCSCAPTTRPTCARAGVGCQADWDATIARVRAMPAGSERIRVNGEWSTIETLRHLVFAVDAWFRRGVLGVESPYTPLGTAGPWLGDDELPLVHAALDRSADPTLDEVLAVRAERVAELTVYLEAVDAEALARPAPGAGRPRAGRPTSRTARSWRRCTSPSTRSGGTTASAVRDLDAIEAGDAS